MLKIKIDEEIKNKIIEKYSSYQLTSKNIYLDFYALINDTKIQIYSNAKKNDFKLLIDGEDELKIFNDLNLSKENLINEDKKIRESTTTTFINLEPQIGSDEVGFGDFFGPIVVVAAYYDENFKELFDELKFKDSKKLTDKKILEIVPKILDKVKYSCLVVDDIKLNELINKKMNFNQIKSILHNTCLNNLYNKIDEKVNFIFIDQFNDEKKYYEYIKDEKNELKNITFEIHGEEKFPSVALASCIARYVFLEKMEILNKKYNVKIPFGASKIVDDFALNFKNKYGLKELQKISKTNFKNFKKLT